MTQASWNFFLDSIRTKTPMRRKSKSETRPLQTKNNEFSISRNSFFAACLLLDKLFRDMRAFHDAARHAHKNANPPIFEIFVIPFMQVAQSTQCESVETAGIFVESPSFFYYAILNQCIMSFGTCLSREQRGVAV